ncbi:hypothetical protein [Enterococcus cecorum]|uniref:hypothetical protein n=1 Tax=Enterococcus cecorum TaxID=44008 RepID=UPI002490BEFA|nr:hypothetical protein [Enterococcus cecorum]CAI3420081.1 hypothetical protein CIRMBP1302_01185 [Enterococcus cecorum]
MVNMVNYFNAYPTNIFSVFILFGLSILLIFLGYIVSDSKKESSIQRTIAFILTIGGLIMCGYTFCYPLITRYQIIHDAQTEIKKELDLDLSKKQIRELLDDQPTWANHLTKEDIEKHLK